MARLISIFLVFCLLAPSVSVFANELPKGEVTTLEQGDRSPFSGLLFDQAAVIKILTDKYEQHLRHESVVERLNEVHQAELDLLEKTLTLDLMFEKDRAKLLLDSRDEDIRELEVQLAEVSSDDWLWWFLGGVAGGAILAGGTAAVITYVR